MSLINTQKVSAHKRNVLLSCFKPANGSGLARIQDCPNSHVSKTSDNCDIGVFVLVLEGSQFLNYSRKVKR